MSGGFHRIDDFQGGHRFRNLVNPHDMGAMQRGGSHRRLRAAGHYR